MKFTELEFDGVFIIDLEKIEDQRGFFARFWDKDIFEQKGLNSKIAQSSISFTKNKGTIRGIHYQAKPAAEAKMLRCVKGSIYQVIIDLRQNSKTYKKWISLQLDSKDYKILYVPEGISLGFQSLEDNTELFYQISQYYDQQHQRGIRYDDPQFSISWPLVPTVISDRDLSYGPFDEKSLV